MTPDQLERYKRHLLVKEIGGQGQKKLMSARVTIVGVGALGGPLGLSLVAAGVGHVRIYDDDCVDLSNLQRQTQFATSDVGRPKTEAFAERLSGLNPGIEIEALKTHWTPETAKTDTDLLIDASDNFETRFAMNAWSRTHNMALITAAVAAWQGQAMLVNLPGDKTSPCYQCLVPDTPETAGNCNDMGVVGPVAAMTSNVAALMAMKYFLGLEIKPGDLWMLDGLKGRTRTISVVQDPECPVCRAGKT